MGVVLAFDDNECYTTLIKVILEYEETDEVCFFIKKSVKKQEIFNYIVRWFSYAFPTVRRQKGGRVLNSEVEENVEE